MQHQERGLQALLNYLAGKRILILGFGREGKSTLAFLERHREEVHWAKLGIADRVDLSDEFKNSYLCYSGENYLAAMADFDLVFKSPGISFKDFHRKPDHSAYTLEFPQTEITSQIDLVLRFMHDLKTAAVSGTKGKSTTTSLLYSIMSRTTTPSYLRGNIGIPVLDEIEAMAAGACLCLELSSHQLEYVQASPHVAALTNFYPEHLDHYRDYDEYLEAKLNILRFQSQEDLFILNSLDRDLLRRSLPLLKGKYCLLTHEEAGDASPESNLGEDEHCVGRLILNQSGFTLNDLRDGTEFSMTLLALNKHLLGKHQHFDAAVAAAAAYYLGADTESIRQGIEGYQGLAHRNEWVRSVAEVDYYNDSIATIPQSTLLALETLGNVSCLLVGGMDRGLDYAEFLSRLLMYPALKVICLPDTGAQVFEYFATNGAAGRAYTAETIEEAVQKASQLAGPGTAVLLSPAASSYHRFKNFEERGNAFKNAVLAL